MAKRSGKKQPPKKPVKQSKSMSKAVILALIAGLTLLAVAVVIGVTIYKNRDSSQPVEIKGAAEVAALLEGIPQQNNAMGQPGAPVTLYIYEDLKCPTCMKFTVNILPQLINDYVRSGKLRLVFQIQTFVGRDKTPGDSEKGARFALAAGKQDKMWSFTDLFYNNQPAESQRYFTDEFLRRLGQEVPGLDVDKAFSEMDSDTVTRELSEHKQAFQATGFTGVPSFQIGKTGGPVTALSPTKLEYSAFKSAIDKQL